MSRQVYWQGYLNKKYFNDERLHRFIFDDVSGKEFIETRGESDAMGNDTWASADKETPNQVRNTVLLAYAKKYGTLIPSPVQEDEL